MATKKVAPLRVCITGAMGNSGRRVVYMVASGEVFGADQPVALQLLDLPSKLDKLIGYYWELIDCALPTLHDCICTSDPAVAFSDVSVAILSATIPYKPNQMNHPQMMGENAKIYKNHATYIEKFARKDVRVFVMASPCNTLAWVCMKYAPSIPKENFVALNRLDANRARSKLAQKLRIPCNHIHNIFLWGNSIDTLVVDFSCTIMKMPDGNWKYIEKVIKRKGYLRNEFLEFIRKRGSHIYSLSGRPTALSLAKAACDQLRDWMRGTLLEGMVSMAVISDGSYGVHKGIFFGYPVGVCNKKWEIIQNLPVDDYYKELFEDLSRNLTDERNQVERILYLNELGQQPKATRVCVAGAAGHVGSCLLHMIANGDAFGPKTPVAIQCLDVENKVEEMEAMILELTDCIYPLLRNITFTTNPYVAMKDVDVIFFAASFEVCNFISLSEFLECNAPIYYRLGLVLNAVARKDVRSIIIASPSNTLTSILMEAAPSIPRQNFAALSRLETNRVISQLTYTLSLPCDRLRNIIVWGNQADTVVPDCQFAYVHLSHGKKFVKSLVKDAQFFGRTLPWTIRQRCKQIYNLRGKVAGMSAAKAACDEVRDWNEGTEPGRFVSMAVTSDGSYGVPKNLVFGFPVEIRNQQWRIVKCLPIDEDTKSSIKSSWHALFQQKILGLSLTSGCDECPEK